MIIITYLSLCEVGTLARKMSRTSKGNESIGKWFQNLTLLFVWQRGKQIVSRKLVCPIY